MQNDVQIVRNGIESYGAWLTGRYSKDVLPSGQASEGHRSSHTAEHAHS